MPNPTTITDLEDRFRPLTNDEAMFAQALLEDAWAMLLARRPTLEADLTAGTVSVANTRRVVSSMVVRVLRNPAGVRQDTTGPFSVTYADPNPGGLWITEDELRSLLPSSRVRSVRLRTAFE